MSISIKWRIKAWAEHSASRYIRWLTWPGQTVEHILQLTRHDRRGKREPIEIRATTARPPSFTGPVSRMAATQRIAFANSTATKCPRRTSMSLPPIVDLPLEISDWIWHGRHPRAPRKRRPSLQTSVKFRKPLERQEPLCRNGFKHRRSSQRNI